MFFINPFIHAGGGDFESIATVTLGSAASNIEFTSIPSTFQHLQIRFLVLGASVGDIGTQFNGVTGFEYTRHFLQGNGSAASAGGAGGVTDIFTASFGTSSGPGAGVVDLLDYASTTKAKTLRAFTGYDANGSGVVRIQSGLWTATSAVTSVKMFGTQNFAQHSTFALYGVKAP